MVLHEKGCGMFQTTNTLCFRIRRGSSGERDVRFERCEKKGEVEAALHQKSLLNWPCTKITSDYN